MQRIPRLNQNLLAGAVLAGFATSALAQTEGKFPPVSDNAALQYWQAFTMLPALDAQQEKLLENWADAPLDDAAVKLLDQSRASLMFLHRGAKLPTCDWGLDYRDGVSMYLPHLAKARTLARLAALDARRAIDAGNHERFRDNTIGILALARRVGGDLTMVSMLISYAMEEMVVDVVAANVTEVGASYAQSAQMLASLPPRQRLSQGVVLCEKWMAQSIASKLQEAEERRPGSWRETWRAMLGDGSTNPFEDSQALEQVIKSMEEFQVVYDELAQLAALPAEEFDAEYPRFRARARAASPVAEVLLPAIDRVVAAQRRCEARMAMLLAAVAVVESGPEKLADIQDPFGEGPFRYRKLDAGFELSSELTENGRPVTLVIGQ